MFVHLTLGEIRYLNALCDILGDRLEAWSGVFCVDPAAWIWNRAQLRIELHFLFKERFFMGLLLKEQTPAAL